jgi:hypothetical protein
MKKEWGPETGLHMGILPKRYKGKNKLFSKVLGQVAMFKSQFNFYLIPNTKINPRWIQVQKVQIN